MTSRVITTTPIRSIPIHHRFSLGRNGQYGRLLTRGDGRVKGLSLRSWVRLPSRAGCVRSYTQLMATLNDRIGDVERDRALQALGVHYAHGRLDISEYEHRSELALSSQTKMELDSLFLDLPSPHYNRGLSTAVRQQEQFIQSPPQMVRELDPWDQPIGNSPLTLRKARKIGWLLAIAWIPMVGPIVDAILPGALVGFVTFLPTLLMIVMSILMKPNTPRYRVIAAETDRGKYPY